MPPGYEAVKNFVTASRSAFSSARLHGTRKIVDSQVHPYSFTMYVLEGSFEDAREKNCFSALAQPEKLGAGLEVPKESFPGTSQLKHQILHSSPHDISPLKATDSQNQIYATWETIVVDSPEENPSFETMVTLLEFRVQTTWTAAFYMSRFAAEISSQRSASKSHGELKSLSASFGHIVSRHDERLGPNSPEGPSEILDLLIDTSDLNSEIERARSSLESAKVLVEVAIDRYSSRSRKLLEIFGLLFASTSVGELLFPTPITVEVVKDYPFQIIMWAILNAIAIGLVARSR